jgi:N-methylhydantoinase B
MTIAIDAITVSVIQHRLHAIVAEMGEAMLRTSYSQILNSSRYYQFLGVSRDASDADIEEQGLPVGGFLESLKKLVGG